VKIAGGSTVLLPARLAVVNENRRRLEVQSITAAQFADVPRIKNPNQVTLLEEDKITGYYAGGKLYATPDRQGPLV
jgi:photosynthetic reaction center H subunit